MLIWGKVEYVEFCAADLIKSAREKWGRGRVAMVRAGYSRASDTFVGRLGIERKRLVSRKRCARNNALQQEGRGTADACERFVFVSRPAQTGLEKSTDRSQNPVETDRHVCLMTGEGPSHGEPATFAGSSGTLPPRVIALRRQRFESRVQLLCQSQCL